jgi:hypothetical protein
VLFPELSVLRNGKHIDSSPSHPDRVLRSSANGMFMVSAFLIVAGAFGLWDRNWITFVFGCFYLAGAILLRRRRRLGAAVIAIPLFVDMDFLVLAAVVNGMNRSLWTSLLLNLLFSTFVIRAYQAARDSRELTLAASDACSATIRSVG